MTKFSDEAADYALTYVTQTDSAWCVSDGEEVWLPKSQCEVDGRDLVRGRVYTFTVPNWLAEKKGLA